MNNAKSLKLIASTLKDRIFWLTFRCYLLASPGKGNESVGFKVGSLKNRSISKKYQRKEAGSH
jgi:hypothetical protein